jgi:ribonuclease P/MRP protein subunit POP5
VAPSGRLKRAKAFDGKGVDPMLSSVEKSVEKERKREDVLAVVDQGGESDDMSE